MNMLRDLGSRRRRNSHRNAGVAAALRLLIGLYAPAVRLRSQETTDERPLNGR